MAFKDMLKKLSGEPIDQTKDTVDMFEGGLNIDLDKKLDGGKTVLEVLSKEIDTVLERELVNREPLMEKVRDWHKQFRGEVDESDYPYPGAANMAVPLTRWLIETVVVRLFDALFGQRKIWVIKALEPEFIGIDKQFENGLDWWAKWIVDFKKIMQPILLQAAKVGTGFAKLDYRRRVKSVYRYAEQAEIDDKSIKTYKTQEGEYLVKSPRIEYEGPVILPISIEDFVISSNATDIQDAYICGFRTYIRHPQLQVRINKGLYRDDIVDKINKRYSDQIDDAKVERAESQGLVIGDDLEGNLEIWELWLKFDVDEDGEEDDIVVTWHRGTNTVLRAIYNPSFYGWRPFKRFVFNPVEYSPYGEGLCGVLEKLQEEINSIHNQRLDRMNQINNPMYLIREGCGLDSFKRFPGVIGYVDDIETSMAEFRNADVYPSTFNEEALISSYAERTVGVSQQVMGQSTSERPVAKETLALLQEANKKFKFYIDNARLDFTELGMMVLEMFAQYAPTWEYKEEFDEMGQQITPIKKSVEFPPQYIRDGVKIDLAASSEVMNQEVRRQIDIVVYQMMTDYYTKLAGMVQAVTSPMIPAEFKKFIFDVSKISGILMTRILEDFEIIGAEDLILDMDESFDINTALAMSMPMGAMPPGGPDSGGGPSNQPSTPDKPKPGGMRTA